MLQFFLTWLATAVALLITAYVVPGFKLDSLSAAAIGAVVLGLVNAVVKPILFFLTLPLTILTLGLFLLVLNAISLQLVAALTPGFDIQGFLPALFGSLVLSAVSYVLHLVVGDADAR